jgi:transcriptional regulator with XRE-family HTH domain
MTRVRKTKLKIKIMDVTTPLYIPGLGEKLRTLRKAKGLNQEDVAIYCGKSTARISEIEREQKGREGIPIEFLIKLNSCLSPGTPIVPFEHFSQSLLLVYEEYKNRVAT